MAFDISIPFAGAVHDFSRPLRERAAARKHCGPYHFEPAKTGAGRGFYMESGKGSLECARHGSGFRLRVIEGERSYGFDEFGGEYQAIVLRLPRGRGFLAGATMGAGMCAHFEPEIYRDEADAMRAADIEAEHSANAQAEFEAKEQARLDAGESGGEFDE